MTWQPIETASGRTDDRLIGKTGQPGGRVYVVGEIYFDDNGKRWIWSIDRSPVPAPEYYQFLPSDSDIPDPRDALLAKMAEALNLMLTHGERCNWFADRGDEEVCEQAREALAEYEAATKEGDTP